LVAMPLQQILYLHQLIFYLNDILIYTIAFCELFQIKLWE
jgi:hypothetical protein